VVNCGFETGDFSGWVVSDASAPLFPLQVVGAGTSSFGGLFVSAPTQGSFAAVTGFDAGQPAVIRLGQDIVLGADARTLIFSYRAGWDLASFCFSCSLDRHFQVAVEPAGGGVPLQTTVLLTAIVRTRLPDTGPLQGTVDLSAFAGTSIRVVFEWTIPQSSTGPAFFQLDNVQVRG
jgi:hypothetical protein